MSAGGGTAVTSGECRSCLYNSGERRISPGPPIHVSDFWPVEHAYPTRLRGWLVIVLRRHVEALHEVTAAEFRDFSLVLERTVRAQHEVLSCEKEYVACFAELEHFKHVHFHVIPRAADLPAEFIGTKGFALLQVTESEAVSRADIRALCEELGAAMGAPPHRAQFETQTSRTASTPIRSDFRR